MVLPEGESYLEIKFSLRALLLSAQKEGLSPMTLNRDYMQVYGHPVPFDNFGYRNLFEFLQSLPDVVKIEFKNGYPFLFAKVTENVQHIENLVRGQRPSWNGMAGELGRLPGPNVIPDRDNLQSIFKKVGPQEVERRIMELLHEASPGRISLQDLLTNYRRRHGEELNFASTFGMSKREYLSDLELKGKLQITNEFGGMFLCAAQANPSTSAPPAAAADPKRATSPVKTKTTTSRSLFGQALKHIPKNETNASQQSQGSNLRPRVHSEERKEEVEAQTAASKVQIATELLARHPKGIAYEEFKNIYEMETGKQFEEWPGLRDIADPLRVRKKLYIKPKPIEQRPNDLVEEIYDQLLAGPMLLDEVNKRWKIGFGKLLDLLFVDNKDKFDLHYDEMKPQVLLRFPSSLRESYLSAVSQEINGSIDALAAASQQESSYSSLVQPFPPMEEPFAPPEPTVQTDVNSLMNKVSVASLATEISVQEVPNLGQKQLEEMSDLDERRFVPVFLAQYYSPDRFYIQLREFEKALNDLMAEMKEFYTRAQGNCLMLQSDDLRPGIVCAATYGDIGYHRAKLLQMVTPDVAKVYYLDYGTEDDVFVSSLRRLPYEFCLLPAQAIRARLPDMKPNPEEEDWNPKIQELMVEHCSVKECIVWAFVLIHSQNCLTVELTRVPVDVLKPEVHMSEVLIGAGLASQTTVAYEPEQCSMPADCKASKDSMDFDSSELLSLENELEGKESAEDATVKEIRDLVNDGSDPRAIAVAIRMSLELIETKKKAEQMNLEKSNNEPSNVRVRVRILELISSYEQQQMQIRSIAKEAGISVEY